ncbi:hypothetical protein GQ43DRAFT_475833 [Delitschia confertaspora ATCC 74209]|uniref:Uncharacterized protein n=1 Tax=Delitschia confertaspora ATCC 74209 TaxID=1513339 RepID=A0A9P4JCL4_9PLEO|nr:hypothetical protein GQ43DRAFT_475833 [Delitschia confertaspora ATCC 74209]
MPVARPRGLDDRMEYVIVRRSNDSGQSDSETKDGYLDSEGEIHEPSITRAQQIATSVPYYGRKGSASPMQVTMTMTISQLQGTGTALANKEPTETVVVTLPPPPRPTKQHHGGHISKTTSHLLIAAGSIGATIIVVMILLAIHTMRKRGITFKEAVQRSKDAVSRHRGPPPPPKSESWEKPADSIDKDTLSGPRPVFTRAASSSSQRPLIVPVRNNSTNRQGSPVRPSPLVDQPSFLIDSPIESNPSGRTTLGVRPLPTLPLRNISTAGIGPPPNDPPPLPNPEPPLVNDVSSTRPPPPTFRQFLTSRPSISAKQTFGPMISHFSWTNSNSSNTPHDTSRDTNSHTVASHDSFMTERSSVPRFRTIDSWVNHQAGRLEERKLQEQARAARESTVTSISGEVQENLPGALSEVPELPKNVTVSTPQAPALPTNGLPGKNVKHERQDTRETAPIFRHHPGIEVRFSTRSLVPSEILNSKTMPSVLEH